MELNFFKTRCWTRLFILSILPFYCLLPLQVFAEGLGSQPIYTYYPQEEFLKKYMQQMPWEYYLPYNVPGIGSFWVDDAKDCVKDTVKQGVVWEAHIIARLAQYLKKGDRVIDVGAHMGTIALAMSNFVGESGFVYAFEGERQLFRELLENAKLNQRPNIIPYLYWLSDENKEVEAYWNFYKPDTSPVCSAKGLPYPLHVRTLDSFNFKNIALIKINVEGLEDEVLRGARNTIMESRPIILLEIMGGYGWRVTAEVRERIDREFGFSTR